MAQLVYGDREVMSNMVFGAPPPQLQQYIQQTNQYFGNMLTDVGRAFVDTAQAVFARMDSSEAMRIAKAALRMANSYLQHDIIYTMTTVEQVQEAPDSMVRWIMCHPQLRQYYAENRIDGYGERYQNVQPQVGNYPIATGWDHIDYRQVCSGWVDVVYEEEMDEHGEPIQVAYEQYVTCLDADDDYDTQLLDEECQDIMNAHRIVDVALANKQDPTSYYNSQIL